MSKKIKFHARLFAFQFLYRGEFYQDSDEFDLKHLLDEFEITLEVENEENDIKNKINKSAKELGKVKIENYLREREKILEEVRPLIHRNNFENLTAVEQTILTLGYFELRHTRESYNEVINDYVNIAKVYGKADSYSIINGVLDSAKKSIQNF